MLFIHCFYFFYKKKNEEGKRIRERKGRRKYSGNREKGFGDQGESIRETGRRDSGDREKIFV